MKALRAAACALSLLLFAPAGVHAAVDPTPAPTPPGDDREALVHGLYYRQGQITLQDGLAKLTVPDDFRYLDSTDTDTVLVKIWGNPPDHDKTLGMLVPADLNPDQRGSWAVIISYEAQGYVKDNEAESINYDQLLGKMQKAAFEGNAAREKAGYPPIRLVGWAVPPRYDKVSKKLYWAKELQFGDSANHTLNYDIRVLGRRGVLVLKAVAGMGQVGDIQAAAPRLLSMVDFNQGNRYVDFDPKTDHVAAYGLAALVAGGIAAKAGMFKLLWVGLLALKKFVIIGVIAVVGFVKRFFGGSEKRQP